MMMGRDKNDAAAVTGRFRRQGQAVFAARQSDIEYDDLKATSSQGVTHRLGVASKRHVIAFGCEDISQ